MSSHHRNKIMRNLTSENCTKVQFVEPISFYCYYKQEYRWIVTYRGREETKPASSLIKTLQHTRNLMKAASLELSAKLWSILGWWRISSGRRLISIPFPISEGLLKMCMFFLPKKCEIFCLLLDGVFRFRKKMLYSKNKFTLFHSSKLFLYKLSLLY